MLTSLLCELFPFVSVDTCHSISTSQEIQKFLFDNSLEQSAQFNPLKYFRLDSQPEPLQRKSYLKRKELRRFKPQILRIVPLESLENLIAHGTAVMQIVDEDMVPIEGEPPIVCQMGEFGLLKSFCFNPTATNTSKGRQYRLRFTINFELKDGEQKTEVIQSDKFRVVSRT